MSNLEEINAMDPHKVIDIVKRVHPLKVKTFQRCDIMASQFIGLISGYDDQDNICEPPIPNYDLAMIWARLASFELEFGDFDELQEGESRVEANGNVLRITCGGRSGCIVFV